MSAGQPTAKTCVICGEDVSHKPRTKDPKGHYYCQPCYDKARARHESHRHDQSYGVAHQTPTPKPKPKAASHAPVSSNNDGLDGSINLLDDLIAEPPPVQAPAAIMACPKCNSSLPATAIICTNCGYNVQTNAAVGSTKVLKEPRQSSGGVIWPPIMGITSMVFGGFGVLLYGGSLAFQLVAALSQGHFPIGLLAGGTLIVALAAWLLRDGWRILHRNSDGPKWIIGWAITKLLIYGTCLGIILAIPFDSMSKSGSLADRPEFANLASDVIKLYVGLLLAWYSFWPLTVLVFFSLPRIRNNINQWD